MVERGGRGVVGEDFFELEKTNVSFPPLLLALRHLPSLLEITLASSMEDWLGYNTYERASWKLLLTLRSSSFFPFVCPIFQSNVSTLEWLSSLSTR